MTPEQAHDTASQCLARCRQHQPNFPRPDRSMLEAWATAFEGTRQPPQVLLAAVDAFYSQPGDKTPRVGDILSMVRVVFQRWEADPRYRERVRGYREARVLERDRQLAAGTFALERGYPVRRRLEVPPVVGCDPDVVVYGRALVVGCPVCGVGVGEWCVFAGEVRRRPHVRRAVVGRNFF